MGKSSASSEKLCFEEAITFEDVVLVPQFSEVLPCSVDLRTHLTANIVLNIPIISADMDTVTEHKMAIAMALQGGIGIIHKNLTPEKQADEVRLVKRFKNGFIENPKTLSPKMSIRDARKMHEETGYKNFPVTLNGESNGVLVGYLSDVGYITGVPGEVSISDKMMKFENLIIAKEGISIEDAYKILIEKSVSKLFVINAKKRLISLVTITDLEKNEQFPLAVKDKNDRLLVGAAVGPTNDLKERIDLLTKAGVDVLCVSTAHGHTANVINCVKYIKENYTIDVIAGNVVTREGTLALIRAGADAVKAGIGAGSICTTRIVTGAGMPQLTSIMNCAPVCIRSKKKIPLIADGGIENSGDIVKALAAGANLVMLGNLLARTDESAGEIIPYKGTKYKYYRGMGSESALKTGSREKYGQSASGRVVPEGVEGMVPLVGSLSDQIFYLTGGIKGGFGYLGAKDIFDLQKYAIFQRISQAGKMENHPHNIIMTKESPNYSFNPSKDDQQRR